MAWLTLIFSHQLENVDIFLARVAVSWISLIPGECINAKSFFITNINNE